MFKKIIITFFVGGLVFIGWQIWHSDPILTYNSAGSLSGRLGALVFQETITAKDLRNDYRRGRLKVLIVPGHDNQFSGAIYGGMREADLNIEFARHLAEVFAGDDKLQVSVARDLVSGGYDKNIANYFNTERDSILSFKTAKKILMAELVSSGLIEDRSNNNHAFAKDEIAYRLYGINKWINDNDIDLVIHVHFNDYPGHKKVPGKYTGVTVYVPDEQYPNGKASEAIGDAIFTELNKIRPASNNPLELGGVVPGQELIAIGSNASVDAAAVLVEYGYIYEPEFQSSVEREKIFKAMAEKTYKGLAEYLD